MPLTANQRSKLRDSRQKVIRDLLRLQAAPAAECELYEAIASDITGRGLPKSDADWFYKKMQRDGWKFCGIPITDWRAAVLNFYQNNFFPSQRK